MGISHAEHKRCVTKTASYQVMDADLGVNFDTLGAGGAVTFTLPNTATIQDGWWCRFFQAADQNMVVASYGSSDDIVTKNDLAADSVTFSTATELIGNEVEVRWRAAAAKWLLTIMAEETVTATVG